MIDFQSIIIYFGLAVISFFIAKYAELAKSRKAVWLCVLLMAIVAGFRAKTVGIDTKTYVNTFDLITFDKINLIYGIEKSFIYICAGLLSVWENNQFLLFIFALYTNLFI